MKYDSLQRDLHPSIRHRTYPRSYYVYDIDMIEFDKQGQPKAMIELKHSGGGKPNIDTFQMRCETNVANGLNIPFFMVMYYFLDHQSNIMQAVDASQIMKANYYVIPINRLAKHYTPEALLSERAYVELLGRVRGQVEDTSGYDDTLIEDIYNEETKTIR